MNLAQLELIETKVGPYPIERIGGRLEIPEAMETIPYTHGLHRFPGKFIPQIPQYLFRNYLRPKSIILDPFCGSGTTIVEAVLAGRTCVGCDIDPLSVLITKGKTVPLTTAQLLRMSERFDKLNWDRLCNDLIPRVKNLEHWFTNEAIVQLSALKQACLDFDEPIRSFALLLFSSIVRRVSNADDQTQKTYVSHTYEKSPPLPRTLFPTILRRGLERMAAFSGAVPASFSCEINLHDARSAFGDITFDDIVTSPPYIDSIDYIYNQLLEYYWLMPELGLDTHEEIRALRKQPMGMVKSDSRLPSALGNMTPKLSELCEQIESKSVKEVQAVRTFFRDYAAHVSEIRKVQLPGGIYASVVGSSFIRGIMVPTPDALIAIHEYFGYELTDRLAYGIKRHYMKFPRRENSGKIVEDNILIFRLQA